MVHHTVTDVGSSARSHGHDESCSCLSGGMGYRGPCQTGKGHRHDAQTPWFKT